MAATDATLEYLTGFFDRFEEWKSAQRARISSLSDPAVLSLAKCLTATPRGFVNQVVKHHLLRPIFASHLPEFPPLAGTEREKFIARAKIAAAHYFNTFLFPSIYITGCDLLSDSGTTAMDASQIGLLLQGDEAYGSNEGYFILCDAIKEVFGDEYDVRRPMSSSSSSGGDSTQFAFIFHQGRAAEYTLCETLVHFLVAKYGSAASGKWTIGFNAAFDTTGGNIMERSERLLRSPQDGSIVSVGLQMREFVNPQLLRHESASFLGNCDFDSAKKFIEENAERIPFFYLTVTNNKGGGQPVSLSHIRQMSELCHAHGVPLLLDACRFAENCYFIHRDEHPEMTIREISHATFSLVDGFHASLKKDGVANMGGIFVAKPGGLFVRKFFRQSAAFDASRTVCLSQMMMDHQIMAEGHPTYGGLNGRDLLCLAQGLRIATTIEYLEGRIQQVVAFGELLKSMGIPIVSPVGGSAVYIDVDRFFDDEERAKRDEYLGASLVAILQCFGHRLCELGAFAFSGPTAPHRHAKDVPSNYVRAAIPRNLYSSDDLNSLALLLKFLHEERSRIVGVRPLFDCQLLSLHHFKAKFAWKV